MAFHLHIENFRCLRTVDLDLGGVCALIGPNGSGKSTLLGALQFMRDVLRSGAKRAVELAGGGGMFRFVSSDGEIILRVSDEHTIWEVFPRPLDAGIQLPMQERFVVDARVVVEQLTNAATFTVSGRPVFSFSDAERSLLERAYLADKSIGDSVAPLARLVYHYKHHVEPVLAIIRRTGSPVGNDTELSQDGNNIFTVLRNWRAGIREHHERYEFVLHGLQKAFPGLFEDLDFEAAGQVVSTRFFVPPNRPIPFHMAPTGLLAGLLHLAAVASCEQDSTVGIDEFENSLHPHAIRVLIDHIRERAEKMNLTVLLASHSPVVLNQFRDCPSKVIVMDPVNPPTPLDKLENPEWLAQFSLGELYANENIGSIKTAS